MLSKGPSVAWLLRAIHSCKLLKINLLKRFFTTLNFTIKYPSTYYRTGCILRQCYWRLGRPTQYSALLLIMAFTLRHLTTTFCASGHSAICDEFGDMVFELNWHLFWLRLAWVRARHFFAMIMGMNLATALKDGSKYNVADGYESMT
jgi:hypothetical protein